ncbi:MAG: sigma-70 family RNA polymerase sigma factor [Pseudomonadota bacterium]|nr:sigma-70 family RNA polymerase sigma factor [Pseudomonadota bacterium]
MAKHADEAGRAADFAELQAIAGGDREAFARLIDRESPRLLRLGQAILGSLEEAEDVVQETLISLWEHAGRWKPEARIGTWLHRVCTNRSIDRLRRRRPSVDQGAIAEIADETELPDAVLVQGEAARSVRAAMERLPERQRLAVLLFHFQDLSQTEAAEIIGVSEAAFESLLARARRQLRALLSAGGGENE